MAGTQQAPMRPPIERPDPVRIDNLWDIKAEPGRISAAATAWRIFATRARSSHEVVDRHAGQLQGDKWAGDTADTYHWHLSKFDRDLDLVAGLAWESVAKGTDDGWKLPPESNEDPTFIVNGDDIVLNTGPGNDRVTVRVDPVTGEQVVTVNGREFRFPAGSHLTVRAGDGDDNIVVQKGTRVTLTLLGGRGDDNLHGGDGDDTILGLDGKDMVSGGGGNDRISLGASRDPRQGEGDVVERAMGGDGDDVIAGSLGRDAALGDGGNDLVFGGEGDDTLAGNDGDDVVVGGGGIDNVYGNAGQDRAFGGADRDYVDGGAGNDTLDGGLGDDTVYGLSGDDRI